MHINTQICFVMHYSAGMINRCIVLNSFSKIYKILRFYILLNYRKLRNHLKISATDVRKKKKTLCAKKKTHLQKKLSQGEKNLFIKKLIYFVDKLNIIDFNIFNILKLTFTCKPAAYLSQNNFVNVSFNSTLSFLLVFYFDCLFED